MCILQKETEETYHFNCTTHSALLHLCEVHQLHANYWAQIKNLQLILSEKQKNSNQQNQQKKQSTNQPKSTKKTQQLEITDRHLLEKHCMHQEKCINLNCIFKGQKRISCFFGGRGQCQFH